MNIEDAMFATIIPFGCSHYTNCSSFTNHYPACCSLQSYCYNRNWPSIVV